jgi:hypothetical protein
MTGREALTLADVVAEVERAGGQFATTTFATFTGPVYNQDSHYSVDRVDGTLVVDFTGDFDEYDDGADDLRMELVGVTHELAQATKVVDAAKAWALTGNAGGFPHMRATVALLDAVHAHADALAEAITGVPAPGDRAAEPPEVEAAPTGAVDLMAALRASMVARRSRPDEDRAAELAEDAARAEHAERSER